MSELLTIGQVASRTGVATSALRYYDDLGLLEPAKRVSGQRRYRIDAVAIVGVIAVLRESGFKLAEIRQLITSRSRSPRAWRDLAERKLCEIDAQIAKAQVARLAIEHTLACPKEDVLDCPNFWAVVGGVLAGKSLAESHPSVDQRPQ